MNRVTIMGNIGKTPEIKVFDNGNKVANFSVATSETYKNKAGEKVTDTEWHNVQAFGKLADIVDQHFTKGMKILIEGKIKTRSWEQNGEKKYATDIVMQSFYFIGGPASQPKPEEYAVTQDQGGALPDNDDLPFAPIGNF